MGRFVDAQSGTVCRKNMAETLKCVASLGKRDQFTKSH